MNAYLNIPLIYLPLSLSLIFSGALLFYKAKFKKKTVLTYLLVKPRLFSGFLEKYDLCNLIGEMPLKCIVR